MEGVRNGDLRRNLATMYAHEHFLNDPPTVEALRYATQQYLRTRGPPAQAQSRPQLQQRFAATRAMPPTDNQQAGEESTCSSTTITTSTTTRWSTTTSFSKNTTRATTGHVLSVNKLVTLPGNAPTGNRLQHLKDANSLQRKSID